MKSDSILVSCTKGILNDTLETVNEILSRVVPERLHSRLAYLSGPSFAAEVARGLPTVVTIAAKVRAVAHKSSLLPVMQHTDAGALAAVIYASYGLACALWSLRSKSVCSQYIFCCMCWMHHFVRVVFTSLQLKLAARLL